MCKQINTIIYIFVYLFIVPKGPQDGREVHPAAAEEAAGAGAGAGGMI